MPGFDELDDRGTVRVLIADDDRLFAESLMALLAEDERIEVVGQAGSGQEALELVEALRPDLVVMDLTMAGMNGLEATRRLRETHPRTLVLVLTGSTDLADFRAATEVGAAGFLTKNSLSTDVATTILALTAFAGAARLTSS